MKFNGHEIDKTNRRYEKLIYFDSCSDSNFVSIVEFDFFENIPHIRTMKLKQDTGEKVIEKYQKL